MSAKNKEIIAVLTDKNRTPTEQFWDAKEKMQKEAKILTDCLDGHSRSSMHWRLFLMYGHGFIQDADLEEFSQELREQLLASSK